MHPEQAALLRTIGENPGDDTPRLVYADWLEENGQAERAEFIRVQIRQAVLARSDTEYVNLSRRASELLRVHEDTWRAERPDLPRVHWGNFSRGFMDRVTIDDGDALLRAEQMFESGPINHLDIRRITPNAVRFVAGCPYLKRVRCFSPPATATETELLAILESPHLSGLEELILAYTNISNRTVEMIAKQPHFGKLHRLFLAGNRISALGANALADSRTLPMLSILSIFRNPLGDSGVAALAQAPHLQQVRQLELQNTRLSDSGVRALAQSNVWQNGDVLNLAYNTIGNSGADDIANCPHMVNYRLLVLRSNTISDAGAESLARSPYLERLGSLEIGSNRLTDRGQEILYDRFGPRVHW